MLTIDSMTIAISSDLVKITDKYFESTTSPDGEITKMQAVIPNGIFGISSIEVDLIWHILRIKVSSKILLGKYIEGININNIDEVIAKINHTNIIWLPNDNLCNYKVHFCDVKIDYKGSQPMHNYFTALSFIRHSKYSTKLYQTKNKYTGVVFTNQIKSNKTYLKFYDKYSELELSKNQNFAKHLGNNIDCFKNVIRIEYRLTTFKQIKKQLCNNDDNNLHNVLNSIANPIADLFKELTQNCNIDTKYDTNNRNINTAKEFIHLCAIKGICKMQEDNELDRFMQSTYHSIQQNIVIPSNRSRTKRECNKFVQEALINNKTLPNVSVLSYINEINDFLYNYSGKVIKI